MLEYWRKTVHLPFPIPAFQYSIIPMKLWTSRRQPGAAFFVSAARLAKRKRTERQKIGIGVERESACQRGYAVHEEAEEYRTKQIDPDADPDPERQP